MALSDGEKLIVAMLADQARAMQGRETELDTEFIAEHAADDFWAIQARYSGIFCDGGETPAAVRWTHEVLTMWRVIESSFEKLGPTEQSRVKASEGAFGHAPRFDGFDGHRDHAHIARIMIEKLGYYTEFEDREVDAHMPIDDVHERRLRAYKSIVASGNGLWQGLTADQIIEILAASIHPDNR